MRIDNKDLKQAYRWLSDGQNARVIEFLEKKIPLFLDDPNYYAILGRACIKNGLIKDAQTYLDRGLQNDPDHLELRLLMAVLHLKRKESTKAVRIWLDIIEDHPGQKNAIRGLESVKKISSVGEENRFLSEVNMDHYLPMLKQIWVLRSCIIGSVLVLLIAGFFLKDSIVDLFPNIKISSNSRSGVDQFVTSGNILDSDSVDAAYVMTEREIKKTLTKALRDFESYDDNSSRHELNKILHSNVSKSVLGQVGNILQFLSEPDITTLKTNFSFSQVEKDPRLYEGCWVIWKGSAANIQFAENSIQFEFLVGFDQGQILEGSVPVIVPFLAVMEPLPLELLAQIELNDDKFILKAKTLHFLR